VAGSLVRPRLTRRLRVWPTAVGAGRVESARAFARFRQQASERYQSAGRGCPDGHVRVVGLPKRVTLSPWRSFAACRCHVWVPCRRGPAIFEELLRVALKGGHPIAAATGTPAAVHPEHRDRDCAGPGEVARTGDGAQQGRSGSPWFRSLGSADYSLLALSS
jgi:hypothetical protein